MRPAPSPSERGSEILTRPILTRPVGAALAGLATLAAVIGAVAFRWPEVIAVAGLAVAVVVAAVLDWRA